MKRFMGLFVPGLIAVLLLSGLLLASAEPALAKTHFFFGLNIGFPLAPYPVYPYPASAAILSASKQRQIAKKAARACWERFTK
jgi:hypothetical protein